MQIYLDAQYVPSLIHVPVDFEDRDVMEELLSDKRGRKVVIATPQRGSKRAMLDLVETNARHGFEQRFRVMKPSSKAIMDALVDALNLSAPPERIECFDVSHIQGSDTVASMVVWENGRMKKGDYRKFIQGRARPRPGELVDTLGNVLGEHPGVQFFTVGQRRGLGLGGNTGSPRYVVRIAADRNRPLAWR